MCVCGIWNEHWNLCYFFLIYNICLTGCIFLFSRKYEILYPNIFDTFIFLLFLICQGANYKIKTNQWQYLGLYLINSLWHDRGKKIFKIFFRIIQRATRQGMSKYRFAGKCNQLRDFFHLRPGFDSILLNKMLKLLYICALKVDFQLLKASYFVSVHSVYLCKLRYSSLHSDPKGKTCAELWAMRMTFPSRFSQTNPFFTLVIDMKVWSINIASLCLWKVNLKLPKLWFFFLNWMERYSGIYSQNYV